jgi:ferredoxin-type protein NapF
MSVGISRAQFLRGDFKGARSALRPPWALPEVRFRQRCDGCGECIRGCPEGILLAGVGGLPTLDFSQGRCTFCGACLEDCGPRALQRSGDGCQPLPYRAQISPSCLALRGVVCRSCGEICDEDAIGFRLQRGGTARPQIDPGACNGCGGCVRVCPVGAIEIRHPPAPVAVS